MPLICLVRALPPFMSGSHAAGPGGLAAAARAKEEPQPTRTRSCQCTRPDEAPRAGLGPARDLFWGASLSIERHPKRHSTQFIPGHRCRAASARGSGPGRRIGIRDPDSARPSSMGGTVLVTTRGAL